MSVPLDRLYNFLHGLCNHDVLIYRFSSPGSKNFKDIAPLYDYYSGSWLHRMTTPLMFCHDQEPLQFTSQIPEYLLDLPIFQVGEMTKEQNMLLKSELFAKMNFRLTVGDNHLNGYKKSLLCHSEKNSVELEKYEQFDYVGVYWWSHAVIARDWFRYANVDPALTPRFQSIQHDFLVYNRAWQGSREYRLTFLEMLAGTGILPKCNIKFSPTDNGQSYIDYKFKNLALQISADNLHKIVPLNNAPACSSADYCTEDYVSSGIEVVLETMFDDQRNHLTEKSLRPIACGRPFILTATPYSLQYLRDYGFKTFHGLIDETYDTIVDSRSRLEHIVAEMKRISNLDQDSKFTLWNSLYDIAAWNKKHFFSMAFDNTIANEFKHNFNLGFEKVLASKSGDYMNTFKSTWLDNDPILAKSYYTKPGITLDKVKEFIQWTKS